MGVDETLPSLFSFFFLCLGELGEERVLPAGGLTALAPGDGGGCWLSRHGPRWGCCKGAACLVWIIVRCCWFHRTEDATSRVSKGKTEMRM